MQIIGQGRILYYYGCRLMGKKEILLIATMILCVLGTTFGVIALIRSPEVFNGSSETEQVPGE